MHLEILVEDQSGEKALDVLIPKIINNGHTFRIKSYKGIGHIPKENTKNHVDVKHRLLLENLQKLLGGYGKTFEHYPKECPAAVIVVCDLDKRCLKEFRQELFGVLNKCNPQPVTRFCIAIEEMEAWFLGDLPAIKKAYPKAKDNVLNDYKNDSICGTWEKLADAVYPGGLKKLEPLGYPSIGGEKSKWAQGITPHMDVENNHSPSFCYLRTKLRELAQEADSISS